MRTLKLFLLGIASISLLAMFGFSSGTQNDSNSGAEMLADKTIDVYYFHNTRRCATCNAIEKVATEAIDDNFAEMKKAGTVKFQSLNIEKEEGKKVGDKLGITEQSLIVTNGTKTIDLTNQAFMYARSKPDKLKGLIKAAIKNLNK